MNWMFRVAATATLCAVMACTKSESDDSASDDSSSDDSSSDDSAVDSQPTDYEMTLVFYDAITGDSISGWSATLDGQPLTANADGSATFRQGPGEHTLIATHADYITVHQTWHVIDEERDGSVRMLSQASADALSAVLGLPVDPARGIVQLVAYDARGDLPYPYLTGARIDISSAYDLALVSDIASPYGVSPGNTTQPDTIAAAYFVNVAPGPTVVSLTPPEGFTACFWSLGGVPMEDWQPTVVAGVYNGATIHCR